MKKINIPQTDSIEELAPFWDTHDLAEFEDQLEEVPEPVFERSPEAVVTLHLQPREIAAVKQAAQVERHGRGNIITRVGAGEAARHSYSELSHRLRPTPVYEGKSEKEK